MADTQPATAQVTQVQNLSQENDLQRTSPQQEQISASPMSWRRYSRRSLACASRPSTGRADQTNLPGFFKDLPEGHPLRRFFDEYGMRPDEQRPQGRRNAPKQFGAAQGSGFFISADGYIVTNNHVVENATEVEVATNDGKTLKAKVVGTDPRTDLALLKVDGVKDHKFVSFDTETPRVGDWVVAIGNPFGLGGSVTAGIVSARGRDIGAGPYDDFLQIDAPVNRGNSGGPTFNLKGEVVGVNTAIYSPSGGSVGIAFAVPVGSRADASSTISAERRGHPRLARRPDPAGDGRHRRNPSVSRKVTVRSSSSRSRAAPAPRPASRPATWCMPVNGTGDRGCARTVAARSPA